MSEQDPTAAALLRIFQGLPLHAPGDDDTSRAVLSEVQLYEDATVVDMGCGPGRTTLLLAEALGVPVVGIDRERASLEALVNEARARRLPITARRADMLRSGFVRSSIDLLWCEGAAYAVGLETALTTWRPLLGPGGQLVFSELCWTGPERPPAAAAFWASEYPDLRDRDGVEAVITRAGLKTASFRWLPEAGWRAYYEPLEARLDQLEAGPVDPTLSDCIAALREEIAVWRSSGASVGYGLWRATLA